MSPRYDDRRLTDLGVVEYVSPRERSLTPEEEIVRDTAYGILQRDGGSVERAALAMADHVERDSVLVPVPSSNGRTAVTLALACEISMFTGADVCDCLGRERLVESSRERRRRGERGLTVSEHGIILRGEAPPAGKDVVFVDNVVTTGNTFEACRRALGGRGRGLAYARAREVLS